jgi:hypothetical protein
MKENNRNIANEKIYKLILGKINEPITGDKNLIFCKRGSTAVWTTNNTSEGVLDGLNKNESYETTGPFIRIRFFGGWNNLSDMINDQNFVEKASELGVPMGETLKSKPANAMAPIFAVWAEKDPESLNLERIQIIKGWYTNGSAREQIYDVAKAEYADTGKETGEAQLIAAWTDPDFIVEQPALYYARVLEIPTLYIPDEGNEQLETPSPMIQERAWTSPILYTPGSEYDG